MAHNGTTIDVASYFSLRGALQTGLRSLPCMTKKIFTLQSGLLFLCSHSPHLLHKTTSTTLCALFELLTVLLEYLDLLQKHVPKITRGLLPTSPQSLHLCLQ